MFVFNFYFQIYITGKSMYYVEYDMITISKFLTYKFSDLIQNPKMIFFNLNSTFNSIPISFKTL